MAEIKIATHIKKSSVIKEKIQTENTKANLVSQAEKAMKTFDSLYEEIENIWNENEAIFFNDKEIVFYPEFQLLMKRGESQCLELNQQLNDADKIVKKNTHFKKWKLELLREAEARKIFFEYSSYTRSYNYVQVMCVNENRQYGCIIRNGGFIALRTDGISYIENPLDINSFLGHHFRVSKGYDRALSNVYSLRVPKGYHYNGKKMTKMEIMLDIGAIPLKLESKDLMQNLLELHQEGYVSFENGLLRLTAEGKQAVGDCLCKKIGTMTISKGNGQNVNKTAQTSGFTSIDISKLAHKEKTDVLRYYSDCDYIRANILPYDLARLEDPNQGHWELWEGNEGTDLISLSGGSKVYGRNPKSDIKSDCIVGIDFGTKSTVVVCQNESGRIQPMPIGSGNIRKEIGESDFENPTVMQFIDVNSFLQDYRERNGRPYTKWKDLIISHSANESMNDTGVRSDEFYSYLYDLKQWAGEGKKTLMLRDKKGNDILLEAYAQTDSGFDPIEIYAYYIGLYINNMNNGIYLDYLLSFPVTYERDVRNAILKSFERGLKKSLPQSVVEDETVMSRFNVIAGASEPAAYAICALEEYGFEPSEDENIFYGIFDFGGGTSDFDFGMWSKSQEEDLYDYRIEHFGTQGDRYLGGENLLQLLAFEVFSQNIQVCRKEGIPFAKPLELVNVPTNVMGYVNDSQEARMNQKLMMEKLRPFWERVESNEIDINEFSEFQIGLFTVEGALKSNLAFSVEVDKLETILYQRIEKGVKQFFESLKDTFSSKYINKTAKADKIHIFLAGNSSKSPILMNIFNKYIEEWNKNINANSKGDDIAHFVLFPALGTEQARKIQAERHVLINSGYASPNGKTGVAWGLIEGREGGRIEVVEEVSFESEAKFAYYLGIQKGKNFFTKIRRDEEYSKWFKFLPAKRKLNEILFTSLPEAASGNLLCTEDGVLRKRIEIPRVGDDLYIYIRLVSGNGIEYALGDSNGNIDETTILSEKL